MKDSSAWIVQDGPAPHAQHGSIIRMVVLSSPNSENFSEFMKARGTDVQYMDVWSPDEIEKCRSRLYNQLDPMMVSRRYSQFGGVVRSVLVNNESSFETFLLQIGAETVVGLMNISTLGLHDKLFSHKLCHIRVRRADLYICLLLISGLTHHLIAGTSGWFNLLCPCFTNDCSIGL